MRLSHYAVMLRGIIFSSKPQPQNANRPISLNIYRHCSELLLDKFIDCVVDKDYNSLLKYGSAPDEMLIRAWDQIYAEFSEISGSPSYKLMANLSKEIGYLEAKILSISLCLDVLKRRPDVGCIKTLRNYGYNYVFDITDVEEYTLALEAIAVRMGAVRIALTQKRNEYNTQINSLSGKEVTRDDFLKIIATLTKYMGFRIDSRQVTVSEYVSYRKLYEQESEINLRNKK